MRAILKIELPSLFSSGDKSITLQNELDFRRIFFQDISEETPIDKCFFINIMRRHAY